MKVKCPYCSKTVEVSKKNLISQHANLPRKICLGSGQPVGNALRLHEQLHERLNQVRHEKK